MTNPISDVHKFRSFLFVDRARFGKMCKVCWYVAKDDIETPIETLENVRAIQSDEPLKLICRAKGPRRLYFFDMTPHIVKLQRKHRSAHT
jgi:hypothetical protein